MTNPELVLSTKCILNALGDVVHDLQRERGCSSLFLDSGGKTFTSKLDAQREQSDVSIAALVKLIADLQTNTEFPGRWMIFLKRLVDKLASLDQKRREITNLEIRYTQAINEYSFKYTLPLIECMVLLAQQSPEFNAARVGAYANFLQWKERMGLERALGNRGFHTFAFRNPEFRDRMVALLAEQHNYFDTFMALADKEQRECLHGILGGKDMVTITRFNEAIENDGPVDRLEKYSAEAWNQLLTRAIDQLHQAERKLVDGLSGSPALSLEVEDNVVQFAVGSRPTRHTFTLLKSLPLFRDVAEGELEHLLQFSQVRNFEKGKLLFMQNEPVSRLYVVLNGWVKVFNGLENGNEAILQIVGAGDTLLESAVFLDTPTPVNAQVIAEARILSIPAPVIRQRLKSSNSLALSMLNNISLKTQHLVQQIEQTRLKTAQERVGGFLLGLYLDRPRSDGKVDLPYDKALIASYLDMRAETFSRTLKKLKSEGIEIDGDQIILKNRRALCNFCDMHLACRCDLANTEDCPRPEMADGSSIETKSTA
jgi:CRP-like cAMP-binding protein